MKRTTIFIDEQLERDLQALARREGRPMAALVRDAVQRYVVGSRTPTPETLRFIAVGRSGHHDTAERHEELLWEEPARPPAAGRRAARVTRHRAAGGIRRRRR